MRRTLPRLAARGGSGSARTVSDATRFTQTTPHATSKPGAASAAAKKTKASSRFPTPASAASRSADGGRGRKPATAAAAEPAPLNETPEQKVARLRAAHLAAKNAEVSAFDRFISSGRRVFDSAHKVTIVGLIGFTAIAALLTVYTTADMIMYNRKRKAEFLAAQEKMEADSLEAARLAYMRGDATDEQIALVEEANAAAEAAGDAASHIFKMPSALTSTAEASTSPVATAAAAGGEEQLTADNKQKPGSWRSWIFANLKNEEEGESVGTSQARLGYESLSEDDDNAIVRDSDVIRAIEDKQAYLKQKAKAALEQEKENQRKGGPLDRVGIDGAPAAEKPAKKWWIF